MSGAYPSRLYRVPSRTAVWQGDIAFAEAVQLRARSGDRQGPGRPEIASPNLPYLGDAIDFAFDVPRVSGEGVDSRIARVWRSFVMVLTQNCELEFADSEDSRLIVAPIVSRMRWPEGPWAQLRENVIPGYFYLPSIQRDEATAFRLPQEWPEAVVALGSSTQSSIGLIKPRRQLALEPAALGLLQDGIIRFYATRGFASIAELSLLEGKRIARIHETGQTVKGPSRLVKVFFEGSSREEEGDEGTFSYWGVRP